MQTVRQIVLLLLAGVVLAGCRDGGRESFSPRIGAELASLDLQCQAYANGVVTLVRGNQKIRLKNDSQWLEISGVPLTMAEKSSVNADGILDLPELPVNYQLRPILTDRRFPIRRIMIDPGHGGSDQGAVSIHGAEEKTLNLLLAQAVAYELKKRGFEVFMTRMKDTFISLDDRPAAAEKFKADLFVSIHHNAAARQGACGFEIFSLKCQDQQEADICGSSSNQAYHLYRELAPVNCVAGRGVKVARFKVLRLAKCPAVLLECGFLSNPAESAYLATPYYRSQFAARFADALVKFRN